MDKTSKRNLSRLTRIINAWEEVAPNAKFAGLALEEFKTEVAPAFEERDKLAAAEAAISALRRSSTDAARKGNALGLMVVSSVRGDRGYGPDSPLYSALGYKRQSERSSGLVRKDKTVAAAAKPVES